MRYDAIMFDLDGTLLPMELEPFARLYFSGLAKALAPFGIAPEKLAGMVWACTKAMVKNDGTKLNADVFWESFTAMSGVERAQVETICDAFYAEGFHSARAATQENALAAEAVRLAREKAGKVILATNPLFPMAGQITRMGWVGLAPTDFDLVTCYTSDRYCKPNPMYYTDICERMDVDPARCLMIGNDDREDMVAASAVGMETYLVTDCRIPLAEAPWQGRQGSFAELIDFLREV